MTQRTLAFDYADCANPQSGVGGVDGEGWRWDDYISTTIRPANGRMLILNGINANTQVPLIARAGTNVAASGVAPLIITAPSNMLMPMTTWLGHGRVFGVGYKWRIRFKDSTTGDVSGLSPSPDWSTNMGAETTPGAATYLGQKACFRITVGTPIFHDTVQLFRNASGNEDVWYLVEEKFIGSATELVFIDNKPDDELILEPETAGLQPNVNFDAGGNLPPLAKMHRASNGETWLYRMRRMGPYRSGTVSVTVGSNTITRTDTATCFGIERVGQAFRLKTGGAYTMDDKRRYRIVAVGSNGSSLTVTPAIQPSTPLPTLGTTYSTVSYEMIDDRDLRTVYRSEAGSPVNYDPTRAFGVGFGPDDELLHIFSLRGITYGQTTSGIYRIYVDPNPLVLPTIQRVAPDGTVGDKSGCLTPFGWVFLHATRGVLVFDGNAPPQGYETIGTTSPCRPLGEADESQSFAPWEQFHGKETDVYSVYSGMSLSGFDDAFLSEALLCYDPAEQFVHVFYVAVGSYSIREELVYDSTVGCWRGPWRRRCTAAGMFQNPDGTELFVFGDDFGNLAIDQRQNVDMIEDGTGASLTQTGGLKFVLANSSGTPFDATTYKDQGVPVVLACATATQPLRHTFIVDVIDANTVILERNVLQASKTYTYREGGIAWLAQTAWLDASEPAQPKKAEYLRLRMAYRATGGSTATLGVLKNGNEDLTTMTGESGVPWPIDPSSTDKPSYDKCRLEVGSRLFAFVFYGTSVALPVEITQMVLDCVVSEGNALLD